MRRDSEGGRKGGGLHFQVCFFLSFFLIYLHSTVIFWIPSALFGMPSYFIYPINRMSLLSDPLQDLRKTCRRDGEQVAWRDSLFVSFLYRWSGSEAMIAQKLSNDGALRVQVLARWKEARAFVGVLSQSSARPLDRASKSDVARKTYNFTSRSFFFSLFCRETARKLREPFLLLRFMNDLLHTCFASNSPPAPLYILIYLNALPAADSSALSLDPSRYLLGKEWQGCAI